MGAALKQLPFVLDEEVEIAAKLAAQFPKVHIHSRTLKPVLITREEWERLPLNGAPQQEDWGTVEYRDCPCGSTLAVLTEIRDLEAVNG